MKFHFTFSLVLIPNLIFLNIQIIQSRTVLISYDEIYTCSDFCSENECFEFFDFMELKVLADEEDETIAYLNGSWVMNDPLESPSPALVWAEKRYGSKWSTEAFYRRYEDACKDFKNPLDPIFPFFKNQQECPFKIGEKLTWNMKRIDFPVIPPTFLGEWRIILSIEKQHEGKQRKQCKYFRIDVHEA